MMQLLAWEQPQRGGELVRRFVNRLQVFRGNLRGEFSAEPVDAPHASTAVAGFIAPGAGAGIFSSLARSAGTKLPEKAARAMNTSARE